MRPVRPLRRAVLAAVAAAAVGVGVSSCGPPPHPGLSTGSVDVCYRAIPTAAAALHDPHARMIGVHRARVETIAATLPVTRARLRHDADTTVCVVAFTGRFGPGQVELAPPGAAGRYAVAVVGSKHLRLLATAVLSELPRNLGRRIV